jgi:hypothetical protein
MTYLEEKEQHGKWRTENGIITEADVWIKEFKTGKIRTAKKKARKCGMVGCDNTINIGDKYLDTGELKSVFSTIHYCNKCMEREI